jgi:hypothetical protein
MAAGIVDLVWGSLDPAHQPIQAWGDNIPGHRLIAYALAVVLVAGGAAIVRPRSSRLGAGLLAFAYSIFAGFWLPRFFTAPAVLGYNASVYAGVLGGVCGQLIVVAAAFFVFAEESTNGSRWMARFAAASRLTFGLSSICFGSVHLMGLKENVGYVPLWMPFGQEFWVGLTGVAFVLAGVAILSGILDVLAARLLSVMWLVISAVTLVPNLIAGPQYQANWGGNAYNILVAASAWILGDWLATKRQRSIERATVPQGG